MHALSSGVGTPRLVAYSPMMAMSFCQTPTFIVAGSYSPVAIIGARSSNTRDVPAPAPIRSTTWCGSSPAFMPSTIASAVATLWIATSRLATYFMRLPLP